jgi:hypothetical protein
MLVVVVVVGDMGARAGAEVGLLEVALKGRRCGNTQGATRSLCRDVALALLLLLWLWLLLSCRRIGVSKEREVSRVGWSWGREG